MIEAYAIGVAAKLEDDVTPGLLRIIDGLTRANALMLDFTANVRRMSAAGLGLSRNLDKATAGATALGDASASLTRASYVIDTMAASSADLARNMAAARAESRGMGGGVVGGYVGATGGGARSDRPGHFAQNAAAGVGISAAYGLYENARLQDTNIRAAATSQIPFPMWVKTADELRAREFAYAGQYAFATGGRIAPFGDAMLESSRLLRTLKPQDQKILTDAAMPYAAVEAKLKGVSLPEAMLAFIGLAHQAGAYTPQDAQPLFESMMQASLTTHASLGQISRAASYALPSLQAAGANSADVLMLLATMMQAGILNTKSGTWLNDMALNSLPNTLGSGLFKNKHQNAALEALGLYTNGKSNFYKNDKLDLMQMVAILASDRLRMGPEQFNAASRQALGLQGMRAASLFSEPQVVQNLHTLAGLTTNAQSPFNVAQAVQTFSTVAKADQTIANANMTLMNATSTFSGPVNAALSGMSSFFGWTSKFTAAHPIIGGAMDAGVAVGTARLLGAAWKGGVMGVDLVGKKLIAPVLGGLWKIALRGVMGLTSETLNVALGASATLAEAGAATTALGSVIAGALGYGIGTLLNKAMNAAAHSLTHGTHDTWWGSIFHNEGTRAALTPQALAELQQLHSAAPVVHHHTTVQIDGEDVRHHILHNMPMTPAHAPSGINPQRGPMHPGLNYAPGL